MNKPDINGRIESFDQSVRSLNRRLRAVERRLSNNKDESVITSLEPDADQWADPDIEELQNGLSEMQTLLDGMQLELDTIRSNDLSHVNTSLSEVIRDIRTTADRVEALTTQQTNLKEETTTIVDSLTSGQRSEFTALSNELEELKLRLKRQENMNKITIGSIKVPVELSGIVASVALITTGYLVWADQWDIIRSTYYPTGLAVLFALAVLTKFFMTNRQPDTA